MPHENRPRRNGSELDRLLSSDGIWHLEMLDLSQNELSEVDQMQITMALDLGRLEVVIA